MSYFDIIVAILLLIAIIKGYINGFVIEVASMLALVLGVLGAVYLTSFIFDFLSQWWHFKYLNIIIFIIIFLSIVIAIHTLAKTIDEMIKKAVLNVLNRMAGALFGFLKYAFIISVLLAVLQSFRWDEKIISADEKAKSVFYSPISQFAPSIFPYLEFKEPISIIEGVEI